MLDNTIHKIWYANKFYKLIYVSSKITDYLNAHLHQNALLHTKATKEMLVNIFALREALVLDQHDFQHIIMFENRARNGSLVYKSMEPS